MKPLHNLFPLFASPIIGLAACADDGSQPEPEPARQGFFDLIMTGTFGATDGVKEACYSFDLMNGATPPVRITARGSAQGLASAGVGGDGGPTYAPGEIGPGDRQAEPICSTMLGAGGAVSYIVPCDAAPGATAHTLRVWVNSVCATGTVQGGDCVPPAGFQNPCGAEGCLLTPACAENTDLAVTVDFDAR